MHDIRPLTSLRGFAALYVVAYHASDAAGVNDAPRGYLAVDVFFVLSGFVLALSAADEFAAHGWGAYGRFWARRLARIMPLNLFVVGAIVAANLVAHGGVGAPVGRVACNAFALQGFGGCVTLNAPAWTLSFEWLAYAAFPILLSVTVFGRAAWCGAATALAVAVLVAFAACSGRHSLDSSQFGAGFSMARCVGEMVLGMAAYRAYTMPRLRGMVAADAVLGLVVAAALGACWFGEGLQSCWIGGDVWALAAFPALVLCLAANRGWAARWLGWQPWYFLGEISFSIYLLHDALLQREARAAAFWHPGWAGPGVASAVFVAAAAISIIPFAWLTYRVVERPGRAAMRRWMRAGHAAA